MNAFAHQETGCGLRPSHPLVCILDLIGVAMGILFLVRRPELSVSLLPVTVIAQYTTSCAYHWQYQSPLAKTIDNLMIPVLITGTYVQYWMGSLPAADAGWRSTLLGLLLGLVIVARLIHPERETLKCALYLLLGAGGLGLSIFSSHALPAMAWYGFLAGIGLYFAQFLVYALKNPDPLPELLGYREVQHLILLAASGLHLYIAATYL